MPKGGELTTQVLEALGITTVFGLPGTQTVPLWEEFRRSSLRTVLTGSETAASFAACGYFQACGRPAAVSTIPGPGLTMALPGLAEAYHDSNALLLLTNTPAVSDESRYALQAIDQTAIAQPVSKAVFTIDDAEQIPKVLQTAYAVAIQGDPGPVVIQMSPEIVDAPAAPLTRDLQAETAEHVVNETIQTVVGRLVDASRPVIYAGGGCQDNAVLLNRLVQYLNCPLVTTASGRGIVPETDPLVLPYDFAAGACQALNELLEVADCILVLGCKLTHNGTAGFRLKLPPEKTIRVDASGESLAAGYAAKLAVQADLSAFLRALVSALPASRPRELHWAAETVQDWRKRFSEEVAARIEHLSPIANTDRPQQSHLFEQLRATINDNAVMVTDSGNHQIATRAFWRVLQPRTFVLPSDFQSMGYGLPAAIGAGMARPDSDIVAVVGDGSMALNGTELLTAVRENISLTVMVFNDGHLGQIRDQQVGFSGRAHGVKLTNPDFHRFAESLGISYFPLIGDTASCLADAFRTPGVRMIEVVLSESPSVVKGRRRKIVQSELKRRLPLGLTRALKRLLGR